MEHQQQQPFTYYFGITKYSIEAEVLNWNGLQLNLIKFGFCAEMIFACNSSSDIISINTTLGFRPTQTDGVNGGGGWNVGFTSPSQTNDQPLISG